MGVSGRVGRREAPVRTNENLSINGLAKRTKTGRGVAEGCQRSVIIGHQWSNQNRPP
jgi:hypothetical protein